MTTQDEALTFAVNLAQRAGELQLASRADLVVRGVKAHANDFVSDVDLSSEELIVSGLADAFPADGVLGEEGANRTGHSGRRWIIDPIDGTRNYVTGSGPWSVCLALQENYTDQDGSARAVTTLAVAHDPAAGETFTALTGSGAKLNGAPIHASAETSLDRSLLALTFNPSPTTRERVGHLLPALLAVVGDLRRYPAALQLAYLAAGRVDVGLLVDTKPWDVAAGHLIAAEAGVALTGPGGSPAPELTVSAAPGIRDQFHRQVAPLVGLPIPENLDA